MLAEQGFVLDERDVPDFESYDYRLKNSEGLTVFAADFNYGSIESGPPNYVAFWKGPTTARSFVSSVENLVSELERNGIQPSSELPDFSYMRHGTETSASRPLQLDDIPEITENPDQIRIQTPYGYFDYNAMEALRAFDIARKMKNPQDPSLSIFTHLHQPELFTQFVREHADSEMPLEEIQNLFEILEARAQALT